MKVGSTLVRLVIVNQEVKDDTKNFGYFEATMHMVREKEQRGRADAEFEGYTDVITYKYVNRERGVQSPKRHRILFCA